MGAARFSSPRGAAELAGLIGAVCEGDGGRQVLGVARLDDAGPHDLAYCAGGRWLSRLPATRAGVVLLGQGDAPPGAVVLRHVHPRRAFAKLLAHLFPEPPHEAGVHKTAVVHDDAVVRGARVDAYAVIEQGAVVGAGSWVQAHTFVGPYAVIGQKCRLMPHSVVMERCVLGDRVRLLPGAVVGADGFGFVPTPSGPMRLRHVGGVEIADDVEVGANTCVDRAALGVTRVGAGSRLDNLVQVAHGASLGEGCLLAAFSGVAGGADLGDRVTMGGRAAVVDGARVGDDVVLAAMASATKHVAAGRTIGGSPGRPHKRWLRELAALRALPAALRTLRQIERRLQRLEVGSAARPSEDP